MNHWEYPVFLAAQALSELGDHLWTIGLRNYFFENSPWTPAAGLALVFILQAIPVFLFGPWLTSRFERRWRTVALGADLFRLATTLLFAAFVFLRGLASEDPTIIYALLATQFAIEVGALIFQNCRNCLVPMLYPQSHRIAQAHLWANVASLTAAGIVPALFFFAVPSGERISIQWLVTAALVDAVSFALSAASLYCLKFSKRVKTIEAGSGSKSAPVAKERLASWRTISSRYPDVARILKFSFIYNLLLMGPFEIGHVTFLRADLNLPPAALAINLLLFLGGIFAGTLAAHRLWKKQDSNHFLRFTQSIIWDGLTFFPICFFFIVRPYLPEAVFLTGTSLLFMLHYAMVPFVRVSRLAGIQSASQPEDWSSILSLHAVAVEGAGAISVILVALAFHDTQGVFLLAFAGIAATLTGLYGTFHLRNKALTRIAEPFKNST